jgi:hypothetical protein
VFAIVTVFVLKKNQYHLHSPAAASRAMEAAQSHTSATAEPRAEEKKD